MSDAPTDRGPQADGFGRRVPPPIPFGGPAAASGWVYLVGAGPGDPGLVGLRAARLLQTATVVAYDRLAPPALLSLCGDGVELINVGKRPDHHAVPQDELNRILVDRAQAGAAVVRLKGGDPFVLGRGSEEAQACVAAGIAFEVVPGITAGVAVPAYAGIPVTHRGLAPAFAVITGHEDPTKPDTQVDYPTLARFGGTLLFYMGVGRLGAIAAALITHGKDPATPTAVVAWGSTPRQRVATGRLDGIAAAVTAAGLSNPAIVVVGDVAGLRDELAWFDTRPLHGRAVLVPRTRHQASAMSERLRALGAEPIEAPTIEIAATTQPQLLRDALSGVAVGNYDWVAFTSPNGVAATWGVVVDIGADARLFAGARLACVGPGTAAALAECGLRPDLVPDIYTTSGLADALCARDATAKALLPRADIATPTLTDGLRAGGWDVDEVEAYRTLPAAALPDAARHRLDAGGVDLIAFASSSTVRNFVRLYGGPPPVGTRVASIGPVTSATCRQLGLRVDAEAQPHDLDGLITAVVAAVEVAPSEAS